MRVHILGICGTFMGGVAAIAKAAGHEVSGSDQNVYPPMSTQLEQLGIALEQGYDQRHVDPDLDCVVVGNALSRGQPVVEALLDSGLPYYSGPQWLAENVLRDKWVLAVAGTHGKTTTTSMLAWILEYAGLDPGFLIGGIPRNFDISARLGGSKYFVIEADEYDTAFFDKRAKFVHYRPRTAGAQQPRVRPRRHLSGRRRDPPAVPSARAHGAGNGLIVANGRDANVDKLRARGVWTPVQTFSAHGEADLTAAYESIGERSSFGVRRRGDRLGSVLWRLLGEHNLENALAALAAALHVGVPADVALAALGEFSGVKRRLEKRGEFAGIAVYEDFAHHPTAIATTLAGLRSRGTAKRIVAVMEPRSNTMRMGVHRDTLAASFAGADRLFVLGGDDSRWDVAAAFAPLGGKASVAANVDELLAALLAELRAGDHVVLMSNGGFQGLPLNLQRALEQRAQQAARDAGAAALSAPDRVVSGRAAEPTNLRDALSRHDRERAARRQPLRRRRDSHGLRGRRGGDVHLRHDGRDRRLAGRRRTARDHALPVATAFTIETSSRRPDGLYVGRVALLDEPPTTPLPPEHTKLKSLLRRCSHSCRATPPFRPHMTTPSGSARGSPRYSRSRSCSSSRCSRRATRAPGSIRSRRP